MNKNIDWKEVRRIRDKNIEKKKALSKKKEKMKKLAIELIANPDKPKTEIFQSFGYKKTTQPSQVMKTKSFKEALEELSPLGSAIKELDNFYNGTYQQEHFIKTEDGDIRVIEAGRHPKHFEAVKTRLDLESKIDLNESRINADKQIATGITKLTDVAKAVVQLDNEIERRVEKRVEEKEEKKKTIDVTNFEEAELVE